MEVGTKLDSFKMKLCKNLHDFEMKIGAECGSSKTKYCCNLVCCKKNLCRKMEFTKEKSVQRRKHMSDITSTKEAKEFFKNDVFATQQTGIEIVEASANFAKCKFKVLPHHLNANGFVMGGAISTLVDFGQAVASNMNGSMAVSLSMTINFLRPTKAEEVFAETLVEKNGKHVMFCHTKVVDKSGELIATAMATNYKIQ